MKKHGRQSISLDNVYVKSRAVYVGPKEYQGPLGKYFDGHFDDLYCDCKTWEKAEMNLFKCALDKSIEKSGLLETDMDCIIGGDLNNQIIIGSYVSRNYDIPMMGIFSACATSMQGIIFGSMMIDGGFANNVVCVTSSHNATAEKQFRYPTEYGGKKPETSTMTVTGAGSVVLTNEPTTIKITKATIGKVFDPEYDNPLDLGRAMAPSAYLTIKQHLADFNLTIDDYDLIVTGDLSYFGREMLIEMFRDDGIDISKKHQDCGLMIYDRDVQHVHAGGSGCASCATVTYGYLLKQLEEGKLNKILVVATGALHNPIISAQNETIPGVSHAVVFERRT